MTTVGNATCKHQLMHHDSCRPKFTAAVSDVVAAAKLQQKSMVRVSNRTGYKVIIWLLEAARNLWEEAQVQCGQATTCKVIILGTALKVVFTKLFPNMDHIYIYIYIY